jgi:hypothetical protein
LGIADQVWRILNQKFKKLSWLFPAGDSAERIIGADISIISILRLETIQRVPHETAIEDNRVRDIRLWIPKVMAGDRGNTSVLLQEFRERSVVYSRSVIRTMNGRKLLQKLSLKNRNDCASAFLKTW